MSLIVCSCFIRLVTEGFATFSLILSSDTVSVSHCENSASIRYWDRLSADSVSAKVISFSSARAFLRNVCKGNLFMVS